MALRAWGGGRAAPEEAEEMSDSDLTRSEEWPRVELRFSPEWDEPARERLAALLALAGATGWEETEDVAGDTLWTVYFPLDASDAEDRTREALAVAWRAAGGPPPPVALSVGLLKDRDWMAPHREFFRPFAVSDRFAVAPPWFAGAWPFGARERLVIDPGMAFGTGSHETTRLAIRALEQVACEGRDVFDVGTGSGILCFVAARLGARRVVGCDIDRDALVCNAVPNRRANGLDYRVAFYVGGPESARPGAFDAVVANILYARLRQLLEGLAAALHPGGEGRLILGGFLAEETSQVVEDLSALGFEVVDERIEGEWGSVTAGRSMR